MRILSRISGLVSAVVAARNPRRPARQARRPVAVESLEGRALLTGLAGVSVSYGTLQILAPKLSGNAAAVSIDPSNQFVKVSLNGQSEEFNPRITSITSVMYLGGLGGGDTFSDNTSLVSREYGRGSGNHFTGGTGMNYIYFMGAGNTYKTQGTACNVVFEYGGSDTIVNPSNAKMLVYSYGGL